MAVSAFATLRPRSASRARVCIIISQLRPAWLRLSRGVTETVSLLRLLGGPARSLIQTQVHARALVGLARADAIQGGMHSRPPNHERGLFIGVNPPQHC